MVLKISAQAINADKLNATVLRLEKQVVQLEGEVKTQTALREQQEKFNAQMSELVDVMRAQPGGGVKAQEPQLDMNQILLAAISNQAATPPAPVTATRPAPSNNPEMLRQFLQFQQMMSPQ